MLRSMPAALFEEWLAYYSLAPWGEEQQELRFGTVAMAALLPYAKKGHRITPGTFFPRLDQGERSTGQSTAEMKAVVTQVAARWNTEEDDSGSGCK